MCAPFQTLVHARTSARIRSNLKLKSVYKVCRAGPAPAAAGALRLSIAWLRANRGLTPWLPEHRVPPSNYMVGGQAAKAHVSNEPYLRNLAQAAKDPEPRIMFRVVVNGALVWEPEAPAGVHNIQKIKSHLMSSKSAQLFMIPTGIPCASC